MPLRTPAYTLLGPARGSPARLPAARGARGTPRCETPLQISRRGLGAETYQPAAPQPAVYATARMRPQQAAVHTGGTGPAHQREHAEP